MLETNYQLGQSKKTCLLCGTEFQEGEPCFSALQEDESGDLTRKDFCSSCWAENDAEFFSHWQTSFQNAHPRKKVDENELLAFYNSLETKKNGHAYELRYILALYLARKKKLQLIEIKNSEKGEELVFDCPENDKRTVILDPELSNERIEELTEEIDSLFSVKLSKQV